MKKQLWLGVAATSLALVLAACGGKSSSSTDKKTIRVMSSDIINTMDPNLATDVISGKARTRRLTHSTCARTQSGVTVSKLPLMTSFTVGSARLTLLPSLNMRTSSAASRMLTQSRLARRTSQLLALRL